MSTKKEVSEDPVLNDEWVEVVDTARPKDKSEAKPKKKRSGAYSRNKGNTYERKIVNELKKLTGDDEIASSRSESKKLDDMKIDIFDPNNSVGCYIQCKKTQTTPPIKKLNEEVGLKDRPLAIFWEAQVKKAGNVNITSAGEYVIIPKDYYYDLLKAKLDQEASE